MKYYHLFDNYYYLPDYKCFVSTISLIECVKLPSEFTSLFTDIQHSASNNERSLIGDICYLILAIFAIYNAVTAILLLLLKDG